MKYVAVFFLVVAFLSLCLHPQVSQSFFKTNAWLFCMGYAYIILICAPPAAMAFQNNRKKAEFAAGVAIFIFFITIKILEMKKIIHLH